MKLTTLLITAIIPFTFISCGDKETFETNTEESKNNPILEYILLKEKPVEAINISDLRTNHKAGETVTFSGQIIGAKKVFSDNLAVITMGDPSKMTTCNLRPGDGCVTPWDVCCDDHKVIKDNIVTVQILDQSGAPIKAKLKGLAGIKEMSALTITGVVDKSSNEKNMIINATGIFVN
ncbi:MAG: hypothetical protein ACI9E1_000516 [Cryomorphaceae bacterium]|jgi:hypothetical protein